MSINKNKGFTIIELAIVIAIFLFIISAAVGIFISVVKSQRVVLANEQIINQISYLEEYMSKALRMAQADSGAGTCTGENNIYQLTRYSAPYYYGIKFLNGNSGECQEFYWNSDDKILYDRRNNVSVALSSVNLKITSIKFYTIPLVNCGNSPSCVVSRNGDSAQPRISISISVTDAAGLNRIIQVTVSARNLNNFPSL
jgi:prepilin-type N-terminal cleavage/methylation domain-containing protein